MFTSPSNQSLIKLSFDPSQSSIGVTKPKLRGLNVNRINSLKRKQSVGGISDVLGNE